MDKVHLEQSSLHSKFVYFYYKSEITHANIISGLNIFLKNQDWRNS